MDIKRNGSQASGKGPAEYFTGWFCVDPLLKAPILHVLREPASRLNRVPAPPGIRILSVKP